MKRSAMANIGLAVIALGLIAGPLGIKAGEPTRKIRVIYTNDTLGYIEPCG